MADYAWWMRVRYPRTSHLPWSPGATKGDVRLADLSGLEGREVVVTEKLDGENTTLYADGLHARSPDSGHHPSRAWVKGLHARIGPSLPRGLRICGENLTARHSIAYDDLLSFFYGFGVWEGERCWSWDETVAFLDQRGIPTPRVRYRGPWNARLVRALKVQAEQEEGYVVRIVEGFERAEFASVCAKWVRPHHVRTDAHWMSQPMVPNRCSPEAALWDVRAGGPLDEERLWTWLDLPGAPRPAIDRGGLGPARLALALASLLPYDTQRWLPHLARVLPCPLAVRVHHLVALHDRLRHRVDDDTRAGGLVSLARSCDLTSLHLLAARTDDEGAAEQVAWSRLVADDAGLLSDDPIGPWTRRLVDLVGGPPGDLRDYLVGEALTAWAHGVLRSPEEAAARAHPDLERAPPRLTVLVGPAGTGKSTQCEALDGRVVSLDRLRGRRVEEAEVLRRGLAALDEALQKGVSAVWDATSLTAKQRQLPLGVARRRGACVHLVSVLTPPEVAASRNRARARRVPDEVVAKQWARLRWPAMHEAHRVQWVVGEGGSSAHR